MLSRLRPCILARSRSACSTVRHLSTTSRRCAALALDRLPARQPTKVLSSPSPKYLAEQELDIEVLPKEEVKLGITDRAAEQLRSIATREHNSDVALRIVVDSGGCHGYQYKMELAHGVAPDDYHFAHPTLQPSNIVIDAVSFPLLKGSTVDYATELIGSSFRISDNPQAKGSGCGCGISWELKE